MTFFTVDADRCDGNGACVEECPIYLLAQPEAGALPVGIEGAEDACFNCGHCVAVCPHEAISYHGVRTGKSMSPEELVPIDRKRYPSAGQMTHLLKSRRAIRNFQDKALDRELLLSIIDVARYSPTGLNLQQVEWSVLATHKEVAGLRDQIFAWMRHIVDDEVDHWARYSFPPILESWEKRGIDTPTHNAPAVFVTHSPKDSVSAVTFCTIAMAYAELTAPTFGVDTCWVGLLMMALEEWPPLREYLGVPAENMTHAAMLLGYAKHNYRLQPTRNEPKIYWQ